MTFKATVLGALASFVALGAAVAADLPSYKAPPPPPPPAAFDWSGYHFGVSGAWGGGTAGYNSNITALGPFPGAPGLISWTNASSSYGTTGYLVGFQSGASWQLANNVVLGYESDFNYADVNSTNGGTWGDSLQSNLRWFGTERLRFGYAFGRLMPYITGGLAYGQLHTTGVYNFAGIAFPTSVGHWQAGWTVGAGLEYAVFDKISVKAEYLYSSLQGNYGSSFGVPTAYRTFVGTGFDTHIARVGVNYQLKSLGALIGMPQLGL
ncbi:outer membrane beta-barrel protein [Methylocystis sp. IM3]|jgi:outer membrane immunogenic protein|uniref:outer membrane protein n=1 Tax=unclassified Methylocystis TaxID=2625913 RepID=UPI000F9B0BA0|nr:MAG: porin family protein [Hyphomicrobiales bacterium]